MTKDEATTIYSRVKTALDALNRVNTKLSIHNLRLATGKRINSAGDDPAGLTLGNSLDVRARSYLEANCAHCHSATGFASSTSLRLASSSA